MTPSSGCDCTGEKGHLLILLLLVGLSCGLIGYCFGLRHRVTTVPDFKRAQPLPAGRKGKGGGIWWDGGRGRSSASSGGPALGE